VSERERRVVSVPVELRVEGEARRLAGYAALFDTPTEIAGQFREQIAPGAFSAAVTRDDVRALFNHDPNYVIGRTTAGTLTLREDGTGLAYDVVPPDTTWARDLMVSVERGDISQSSFGFIVEADEWTPPATRGELPLRTITRVSLFDVSPVTFPAYPETTVSARSQAQSLADALVVEPECAHSARLSHALRQTELRRRDLALRTGDSTWIS
jgi:HK97 family phage prohead protease